jgi:hypothetical protein
MHILQTLTQQDGGTMEGTLLSTMHSHPAHETPTRAEEQICISVREATKSIEGITVYSNRNARGERQILVEDMPVGMVE